MQQNRVPAWKQGRCETRTLKASGDAGLLDTSARTARPESRPRARRRRRRTEPTPCPCRRSRATRRRACASRPTTRHGVVPSGSAPRHTRTNGFESHSRPIVVSSVWPGNTRRSCGIAMYTSITTCLIAAKSPPPTASLKRLSPEKTSSSLTTKQTMSSEWPGVGIASISRSPDGARPSRRAARARPRARRDRRARACAGRGSASRPTPRPWRATARAARRCRRRPPFLRPGPRRGRRSTASRDPCCAQSAPWG